MPVGMEGKGVADVTIDNSKNRISGSEAKGGEGVIRFTTDGLVSGTVEVLVWNEEALTDSATFIVSMVHPDTGVIDQDDPDLFVASGGLEVPANATGVLHTFNIGEIQIESGTEWAISAKSSRDDGAFLKCVNNAKPLMKVTLNFKEIILETL